MHIVQTVAPSTEPITLAEAKDFLNMLGIDYDDDLVTFFIRSARNYAEEYTNRQLLTATFELYNDCFIQDLKMKKNPIQSISSVEYMDENGVYQILDASEYYLYGEDDIFKIHFESMPTHKKHKQAIKITFVAGYGDPEDIPESILHYIRLTTSTAYENREIYQNASAMRSEDLKLYRAMIDFYRVSPL